jgi:hypothetical protein
MDPERSHRSVALWFAVTLAVVLVFELTPTSIGETATARLDGFSERPFVEVDLDLTLDLDVMSVVTVERRRRCGHAATFQGIPTSASGERA